MYSDYVDVVNPDIPGQFPTGNSSSTAHSSLGYEFLGSEIPDAPDGIVLVSIPNGEKETLIWTWGAPDFDGALEFKLELKAYDEPFFGIHTRNDYYITQQITGIPWAAKVQSLDYRGINNGASDLVTNKIYIDDYQMQSAGNDGAGGDQRSELFILGAGDDIILYSNGNDVINGGSGFDRMHFTMNFEQVSVTRSEGGAVQITHEGGTTTTLSVEAIQFWDGTLRLDRDPQLVELYRVYQAAFGREPDAYGLGFWYGNSLQGGTLGDAAAGFIESSEFQTLYGSASDPGTFVSSLYTNILGRPGEANGVDFWIKSLEDGNISAASLLVNFSESSENMMLVEPKIEDGIFLYYF